jgi:bacterioferritin-associated ferredoxin
MFVAEAGLIVMYVCICNNVTDKAIRTVVQDGVSSMEALAEVLNVGQCCGRCKDCARKILHQSLCENTHNCVVLCDKKVA